MIGNVYQHSIVTGTNDSLKRLFCVVVESHGTYVRIRYVTKQEDNTFSSSPDKNAWAWRKSDMVNKDFWTPIHDEHLTRIIRLAIL